jgi:hypothetical protein
LSSPCGGPWGSPVEIFRDRGIRNPQARIGNDLLVLGHDPEADRSGFCCVKLGLAHHPERFLSESRMDDFPD